MAKKKATKKKSAKKKTSVKSKAGLARDYIDKHPGKTASEAAEALNKQFPNRKPQFTAADIANAKQGTKKGTKKKRGRKSKTESGGSGLSIESVQKAQALVASTGNSEDAIALIKALRTTPF